MAGELDRRHCSPLEDDPRDALPANRDPESSDYTFTFALVLRYWLIAPLMAARRHQLRVVAVIPEAPGVVSIVIQGRHLAELRAEPSSLPLALPHPGVRGAPPTRSPSPRHPSATGCG